MLKDIVSRAVRGQLHLPPYWLRDVGPEDFSAVGLEFLDYAVELGRLKPGGRVLDIGCGCGRMALPLAAYLDREALYVGLDVAADSIQWCQQHITPRFPNFHFYSIDLYNERYNPLGRYLAREYVFPFKAQAFDFVLLASVFTHLLPDDCANYLREIARLLRPRGAALATFFLLNESQARLARDGLNHFDFQVRFGPCRTTDERVPERAVAYDEAYLGQIIQQSGLKIVEPVRYGTWSGRGDGLSFQDMVILRSGAA